MEPPKKPGEGMGTELNNSNSATIAGKGPVKMTVEETLAKILAEQEVMRGQLKEKDNQIATLIEAADKGRMAHAESKFKKPITPIVRVSFYNGKLVTGWKMHMDDVHRDSAGVWHEKQVVKVFLEDGKEELLAFLDFQRLVERRDAEIVDRKTKTEMDPDTGVSYHTETFRVKLVDDKDKRGEITIGGAFIN